jgi:hypothetical protein
MAHHGRYQRRTTSGTVRGISPLVKILPLLRSHREFQRDLIERRQVRDLEHAGELRAGIDLDGNLKRIDILMLQAGRSARLEDKSVLR